MTSKNIYNIFTSKELLTLSSIVQIGNTTYSELITDKNSIFFHRYFYDTHGRIRTKMVQMACQLESNSPDFPFLFSERKFGYNQIIPQLKTKDERAIIHIARTKSIDSLPYSSKYKQQLSNNNSKLYRQLMFNEYGLINEVPFYCILAFGGSIEQPFYILQFPEPGFESIAETIEIPQVQKIKLSSQPEFERKKATLKKEFTELLKREVESS